MHNEESRTKMFIWVVAGNMEYLAFINEDEIVERVFVLGLMVLKSYKVLGLAISLRYSTRLRLWKENVERVMVDMNF